MKVSICTLVNYLLDSKSSNIATWAGISVGAVVIVVVVGSAILYSKRRKEKISEESALALSSQQ